MTRFSYTEFSKRAAEHDKDITSAAKTLEASIDDLEPTREKELALTKLEESVMWARKALRYVP
jgi:hypothetical protein